MVDQYAITSAVANAMLQHLNTWQDKPFRFTLDDLPNKDGGIMLQPLQGSGIVRQYIDGSFIGHFSFAVYLRTDMADTKKKMEARQKLEDLANWLIHSPPPNLGPKRQATEIQQESPPVVAVIEDDTEDLQIMFSLYYKQAA